MKTKITAILTFLAASVFAFAAETAPEATQAQPEAPKCAAQPCMKKCPKARPQITPEMREAFVQRMLLSLSDEDLAKLAERVAAIQKMTAEEKAEAIKALPKPQLPQPRPGKKFDGKKPNGPKGECGPRDDRGPKGMKCDRRGPKGPKGMKCEGPRGPRGPQQGAPLPPPPAKDAPAADAQAPEAPAADAPAAE